MTNKKYTAADIKIIDPKKYGDFPVDISKQGFQSNLKLAVSQAITFARTIVVNVLPEKTKYIVYMNASNDLGPLEEGEYKFHDDANKKLYLDDSEISEYLWREGKVPEWINVSVCGVSDEYTVVRLICCGRFSSNKKQIYHAHEGKAPFHVLGPDIPKGVDLSSGEKFYLKGSFDCQ